MKNNNLMSDVLAQSPNRRKLLRTLSFAGAAAGAFVVSEGSRLKADPADPTVVDILQFALNLEYLEAEFYTVALTGMTIDMAPFSIGIDGWGTPGPTTGGAQVSFPNDLVFTSAIAQQIGQDERNHVTLLRTALTQAGVQPIAKPAINLNALGLGFGCEGEFLTLARIFEDIGVTAYGGAAQLPAVTNSPYIGTAARILATEAEHVGNIRLQMARLALQTPVLDGVDIAPPPTGTNFISADSTQGLTAIRTPGQVLFLAYGGANLTCGGFFPQGVNGNIVTSTASA
jgi:hypothetical protein